MEIIKTTITTLIGFIIVAFIVCLIIYIGKIILTYLADMRGFYPDRFKKSIKLSFKEFLDIYKISNKIRIDDETSIWYLDDDNYKLDLIIVFSFLDWLRFRRWFRKKKNKDKMNEYKKEEMKNLDRFLRSVQKEINVYREKTAKETKDTVLDLTNYIEDNKRLRR